MKKTILLVALLLTFSFAPAFADGNITGRTSGQGPSTSVVLDGLRYIWNGVQDFFSSGKGANTTSGSGYVPSAVQPTAQPKQDPSRKNVAPAKEEKKDKDKKETKTIQPPHRPAADQMRRINPKQTSSVEDLRSKIYRSAYHAAPIK
ncbi:MAG: hypothetical protein J5601_05850 [Elusimicrobiaceae bacterium]|nr:hypothetical protein [Elusimicrobiaceae bacterium]